MKNEVQMEMEMESAKVRGQRSGKSSSRKGKVRGRESQNLSTTEKIVT